MAKGQKYLIFSNSLVLLNTLLCSALYSKIS
nr:MAG TPA: hypothetical protein [Caudoviricetes sp.]